MEERKQKEIEYYDKSAGRQISAGNLGKNWDFEGFDPLLLGSFRFCYDWLGKNSCGKKILDFGCGNGIHSVFPIKCGAEKLTGIDLSEKSLEIAKEKAKKEGIERKTEFLVMDCESLNFRDNSFDIVFDGGTFSSLNLDKALPELARILKPEGKILGIETFGHNPLTNLKRKINKLVGKRTEWAKDHIFKSKNLELAKNYFDQIDVYYFHLISWAAFPFLNLPGGKILLKILELAEKPFLKPGFLRKYSFKVVFIFGKPKKNDKALI